MKIAFEIDDKDIRNCLELISGFIKDTGVTSPEFQEMIKTAALSLIMRRQAKQQSVEDAAKAKARAKKRKPKPKNGR